MQSHDYSDWVDRGRPAPSHHEWASYLQWVSQQLAPEVTIFKAHVSRVDLNPQSRVWELNLASANGESEKIWADRLMVTGPGRARTGFLKDDEKVSGLYDVESFWCALKKGTFRLKGSIAVVGAGENAASILIALGKAAPDLRIELISPKGFISTRAENFYENRFYSQPDKNGWKELAITDRTSFIERTDLGVFSVQAMQVLNEQAHHKIVPGRISGIESTESGLSVAIDYHGNLSHREYHQVILATGFDHVATLRSILSAEAFAHVENQLGSKVTYPEIAKRIGSDLALEGVTPTLYLPMLAGLTQGPGFSNLSCLGRLSDRVLIDKEICKRSIDRVKLGSLSIPMATQEACV